MTWNIYYHTTAPVLPVGQIEATTREEAQEKGEAEYGYQVDAYALRPYEIQGEA